jgi:hypothetical protein
MKGHELREATAEFDEEMVIDKSRPLTVAERKTWAAARRKPGRPKKRRRDQAADFPHDTAQAPPDPPPATAALRKRWADLLRRVYESTPSSALAIKRILDHIRKRDRASRAPPRVRSPVALPPAARPP